MASVIVAAFACALTAGAACAQDSAPWRDPSPHRARMVTVDEGVRLEVLDWGGLGRPLILLAGSGVTAHIYDDLAPGLTDRGHVYGVTRRGFGASTHPRSGYDDQRLAADVVAVIEALRLERPVLVGHSAAGNEITTIGSRHPDIISGLVYLDGVFDPKDLPSDDAKARALYDRMPAWVRGGEPPTTAESRTFEGYRAFQKRTTGFAFPGSELRQLFATDADGSRGRYLGSPDASRQMGEGQIRRDYSGIRAPILALFAGEPLAHPPADPGEQEAIDAYHSAKLAFVERWKAQLRRATGPVRIVDLPAASHFMFLSNETETLREIRALVGSLR